MCALLLCNGQNVPCIFALTFYITNNHTKHQTNRATLPGNEIQMIQTTQRHLLGEIFTPFFQATVAEILRHPTSCPFARTLAWTLKEPRIEKKFKNCIKNISIKNISIKIYQSKISQSKTCRLKTCQSKIYQSKIYQAKISQSKIYQSKTYQSKISQSKIYQAKIYQSKTCRLKTCRLKTCQF